VLAAVLTLVASTLMLTVLNLTYNLLAQVVPGWLADPVRPPGPDVGGGRQDGHRRADRCHVVRHRRDVGGFNTGLVSLGVNLLVVFGWSRLSPGTDRVPAARSGAPVRPAATPQPAREPA
jgi:SSS family solute:Na+ symporter